MTSSVSKSRLIQFARFVWVQLNFNPIVGVAIVFPVGTIWGITLVTVYTGIRINLAVVWALCGGVAALVLLLEAARSLPRKHLRVFAASGLTDLAALLAGSRRPALREEWRTHLSGESGHDPVTWHQIRQALGFAAAAVRLRLADAADLAWRPVDAVLGSRTLSNLFVWGPVVVTIVAIVRHDGRYGLVTDDQQLAELGGFLYGVIRIGRWWRRVKPPEPKARRARK